MNERGAILQSRNVGFVSSTMMVLSYAPRVVCHSLSYDWFAPGDYPTPCENIHVPLLICHVSLQYMKPVPQGYPAPCVNTPQKWTTGGVERFIDVENI